jgi:hypothetical protein
MRVQDIARRVSFIELSRWAMVNVAAVLPQLADLELTFEVRNSAAFEIDCSAE